MIGGICGDIIGSRFEGSTMNPFDFELFHRDCDFTDDTVTLIAVMDSINQNIPLSHCLRNWCNRYHGRGYGGSFKRWLRDETLGPYNSYGNGAGMRIPPVSMICLTEMATEIKAVEYTQITHNHPEGLKGAAAIALSCWLALKGLNHGEIKAIVGNRFGYNLNQSLKTLHDQDIYEESCQVTIPVALNCALKSHTYEEAVRNAVWIGGDSDTIASMAGSLGECLFGIPDSILEKALGYLPQEMVNVIDEFYSKAVNRPVQAEQGIIERNGTSKTWIGILLSKIL